MRAGFSLIEMSIVLLIISIVAAGSLNINASVSARNHYQETDETLETVEDYLKFFYQINDRMPCPASLSAKAGESDFGTEILSGSCNGDTTTPAGTFRVAVGADFLRIGALPTRALKLPDAVMQDGFDQRLLYAVPEKFTDSATYSAATGIITVNDGAGTDLSTEAMYVVLSHGEDRKGAYTGKSGNVGVACGASANLDVENCNEDATFTDATFNNGDIEAKFFDDRLLWKNKTNFDSEASGAVAAAPAAAQSTSGNTYCWGRCTVPTISSVTSAIATLPVSILGGREFAQVSSSDNYTCGVTTSGDAYCWGNNTATLGDGSTISSAVGVAVSSVQSFAHISAGDEHACGVTTSGDAYCWGTNGAGQLGNGTTVDSTTPVLVSGGYNFSDISALGEHTCAITTDGDAYCWGNGSYGELGNGATVDSATPVLVSGGHSWAHISAGRFYTCGITTSDVAYCWGQDGSGRLGNGSSGSSSTPSAVAGGHNFKKIDAGFTQVCGLTVAGDAYCWGYSYQGVIGNGSINQTYQSPVLVSGGHNFSDISAGRWHTCAITTDGDAYCWGRGLEGQLADGGTSSTRTTPYAAVGGRKFMSINAGYRTTHAILSP